MLLKPSVKNTVNIIRNKVKGALDNKDYNKLWKKLSIAYNKYNFVKESGQESKAIIKVEKVCQLEDKFEAFFEQIELQFKILFYYFLNLE